MRADEESDWNKICKETSEMKNWQMTKKAKKKRQKNKKCWKGNKRPGLTNFFLEKGDNATLRKANG